MQKRKIKTGSKLMSHEEKRERVNREKQKKKQRLAGERGSLMGRDGMLERF